MRASHHSPQYVQHPELLVVYGIVKAGLQTALPTRHTVLAGCYIVAMGIFESPGLESLFVNCLQLQACAVAGLCSYEMQLLQHRSAACCHSPQGSAVACFSVHS
jgi:hypothetical protein